MATRKLKFDGFVTSTPSTVVITVNGVESFNGEVGVGQPINEPIELCIAEYVGSSIDTETITIEVAVTDGAIKLGTIWNDTPESTPPWTWPNENGLGDGRSNILINGQAPGWPDTEVGQFPLGDETNIGWAGWCFELAAGDTFSCNYATSNWGDTQSLLVPRYTVPE